MKRKRERRGRTTAVGLDGTRLGACGNARTGANAGTGRTLRQ
jgi:hypothetical protein